MQHLREVLLVGFAVLATGCATTGAVPRPFPGAQPAPAAPAPDVPRPVATTGPDDVPADFLPPALLDTPGSMALASALSFRGVPYRNGGSDPAGFDCSGLVQYVFAQHGVVLPREAREQYQYGNDVRLAGVEPGDLIFFRTVAEGPSHVGVAIGGDEFVHAPNTRGVVRVERFSAPYWASRVVGVRRIRN